MPDDDELSRQIEQSNIKARRLQREAIDHEGEATRLRSEADLLRQQADYLRKERKALWERQQPHPDGDMGRYDAFLAELRFFTEEDGGDVAVDIGRILYSMAALSMGERQARLGDFLLSVSRGFDQE